MKRIGLLLGMIVALAFAVPAVASTNTADQEYLNMVEQAVSGKEPDWVALRNLYTQTSFYEPYGGAQAIWYSLQRAGQLAMTEPSSETQMSYNNLLAQHFAHYRSHLQALDMIDKAKLTRTDRAFHQKALAGIVSSITTSGDGKTPETAFKVIDPAEENLILKTYFHYQLVSQEFRQKDGHFWDVINYVNPATEAAGTLYFNVDVILTAPGKRTPIP
ncbi:MAG: DUF4919 domain-containing protein [Alphaproteobacteria bacterium]